MIRTLVLLLAVASTLMAQGPALRVMPIGDSITQGLVGHATWRYPLYKDLVALGMQPDFVGSQSTAFLGPTLYLDFDPDHEGHWGARAYLVLPLLPGWLAQAQPDVVLLHLGHNDLYNGQTIDDTIGSMVNIISTCRIYNPQVTVLVALVTPLQVAWFTALLNSYNGELARVMPLMDTPQSRVVVVDQFTGFDPVLHTYDGIHANTIGERMIADRWVNGLLSAQGRYEYGLREAPHLGPTTLIHRGGPPGGIAFTSWSFDPQNALTPGTGFWAGLHIDPMMLQLQAQSGLPFNVTPLAADGSAEIPLGAAPLTPLAGMTVYGVSVVFEAAGGTAVATSPVKTWSF